MSHELKENTVLQSIFWSEGEVTVGKNQCASITVREQMGQMAMVPWAEAIFDDGRRALYNLALAEGVSVQ